MKLKHTLGLLIALFAILLYVQSVSFGFTLDDPGHISKNGITKEGIKAIPAILTHYYWYGSDDSIPRPEYRPASLIMFATEWQFFKDNPHYYHAMNLLLYATICRLIFLLLCRLLTNQNLLFPFVCTLLYAAHPIHTEVVDSIKSGDELLCFLFALLSILFLLKSIEKKTNEGTDPSTLKTKHEMSIPLLILSALSYFFCIISKETGLAFLVIIPLILYIFSLEKWNTIMKLVGIYAIITAVYLLIRYKVLEDLKFTGFNTPLMNSLLAAPDLSSQKATACYVLLRYFLLLVFPYSLACDYSIATIPIYKITDPVSLIGIILYSLLLIYAIYTIIKMKREKNPAERSRINSIIAAFAVSFYLLTLFPVSNLLITIGSPMAERFLFMPSFGYTIILTFIIFKITKPKFGYKNHLDLQQLPGLSPALFIPVLLIIILYSARTLARSQDWKNNQTLFSHDVTLSVKSARLHLLYGCELLNEFIPEEKNETQRKILLEKSISEFKTSLNIISGYHDADIYFYLGLAYMDNNDVADAVTNLEYDLLMNGRSRRLLFNKLQALYHPSGKYDKSLIDFTKKALAIYPNYPGANLFLAQIYINDTDVTDAIKNFETGERIARKAMDSLFFNFGTLLMNSGHYDTAIQFFDSTIKYNSHFVEAYNNKGVAYLHKSKYREAYSLFNKAIELNPGFVKAYINIGLVYCSTNEFNKALDYLNKAVEMDPMNPQSVFILGAIYKNLGEVEKGQQLMEKANQMIRTNQK